MPTRRDFLRSASALGIAGVLAGGTSLVTGCHGQRHWEVPDWIDNTGTENVSAILSLWMALTGEPGDVYRLRPRPDGSPGRYWVPQGVRLARRMVFDLAGCELFTGTTLGSDDPDIGANAAAYPALWDDWGEQTDVDAWPNRRVVLLVASPNVWVRSSRPGARIQGAARTVSYRSPTVIGRQMSTGCVYDATFDGQHGIRIGGRPGEQSDTNRCDNVVLDLTDISVEFVHGDGVYLNDNHSHVRILGRNLGEPVLGGSTHVDDGTIQGYTGQGGEVVEGGTIELDRWRPDATPLPGIHHTGRHGIATDFRSYDLLVDGVAIWRTGRAIIDLEPTSADAEIVGPTLRNLETGIHTLLWIPVAGPRPIRDLVVEDTVNYEPITMSTGTRDPDDPPERHTNWRLTNNRVVSGAKQRQGAIFDLRRVDGLRIEGNYAELRGEAQGIDPGTSTRVVVTPAETLQFPYSP